MNIVVFEHAFTRVKAGMEKITIDIANSMSTRGHNVLLISDNFNRNAKPIFDHIPQLKTANIDVAGADITGEVLSIFREFGAEVFLFVYAGNNYLPPFYKVFKHCCIPVIFSEHNNPDFLYNDKKSLNFRNALLSMGERIHLLLDEYSYSLPPILKQRSVSIGNPVMPTLRGPVQQRSVGTKKILYVGRINNNPKQVNLLVDTFKFLADKFPEWSLEIWGHGPHEEKICKQIKTLGLEQRIFYRGNSDTIDEVYASGNILCLPSLAEGFPLVVGEAHAYGLPVVGFSSCSGVNSLVKHGKNGLLVDEVSAIALANALGKLMSDDDLRDQMGKEAIESVKLFAPDKIFDQWENLLEQAASIKVANEKEIDSTIMSVKDLKKIMANIPFWPYPGRYIGLQNTKGSATIESEMELNLQLSSQIDVISNSYSWRITAPLRWVFNNLRDLRRV